MAANLFAASDVAAGYANARPAVHPAVIARLETRLAGDKFRRGLDVGCGSGISTRALRPLITQTLIGLEPAETMLPWARTIVPEAAFLAGSAEALPFESGSIDAITAAGSLNYCSDVRQFFCEARRVLNPRGVLAVYDFRPGRRMKISSDLEEWFAEFMRRYPRARDNARSFDPESLATEAMDILSLEWQETFAIPLTVSHRFYVDYMMTETNIAYAIQNGETGAAIRDWIHETLTPVFQGEDREILFDGYIALFRV